MHLVALVILLGQVDPTAKPSQAEPPAKANSKSVGKETNPTRRQLSQGLWFDSAAKAVILDSEVVFREGPLELFLCPRRTKEHESILAAELDPRTFQMALLLTGAKQGQPARFEPYQPPTGQVMKITVEYTKDGKLSVRMRVSGSSIPRPRKEPTFNFVFSGSGFEKPPGTDRAKFKADDGDVVCVANFPGSIIDVSQKSSDKAADQLFEAATSNIPPIGTKVRVYFEPIGSETKEADKPKQ